MSSIAAALELIQSGSYEAALTAFAELEKDATIRVQVLGHRAFLYHSLGNFEAALADWEKFLEANPDDATASAMLARALIEVGRIAEGIERISRVVAVEPQNIEARRALNRAAHRMAAEDLPPYNHMATSREHRPMNDVIQALEADPRSYPASIYPEIGRFIYTFIRLVRPKVVIETGTCYGYSALCISQALKDQGGGHLYCFDIFQNRPQYVSPVIGKCADSWKVANAHLDRAGLAEYVTLVRGDSSSNIVSHFPGESQIDVAFIDGDHLMRGATKDFNAVAPRIRSGGFILFHDIFPDICQWLGPRNLLNRIERDHGPGWRALNIPSPEGCGVAVLQKITPGDTMLEEPGFFDLLRQKWYHEQLRKSQAKAD